MADIYNLNEDPGGPEDADDFIWVVSYYTSGSYDGTGEAIGLHKDGLLYYANLSHCSCYGPYGDGISDYTSFLKRDQAGQTVEDFLKSENIHDYPASTAIYHKAMELLKK